MKLSNLGKKVEMIRFRLHNSENELKKKIPEEVRVEAENLGLALTY